MTIAAVLAFGGTATAFAQDDPTSTPVPTETSPAQPPAPQPEPAPPSSTDPAPTPTSESPVPPSSSAIPVPTPDQVPPAEPQTAAPKQVEPEQAAKQEQQAASPDLKVSVKFDKREYANGEPLSITVTVRNAGDAAANQVRFASEPWLMYLTSGVDQLISRPTLAPGESKTFKLGGVPQHYGGERLAYTLRAYVEGATDPTPNDNMSRDETTVVLNVGRVTGRLFQDKDGDGAVDEDEVLPNRRVKLTGGPAWYPAWESYSSSSGHFITADVPAGTYQAFITGGGGDGEALKPGQFIVVKPGGHTEIDLQVVPALSRSLKVVGYSFDKPEYRKGDRIAVSVTLLNTGTAPLNKVVAVCDPENDPTTLDGTGDGWAEVSPDGEGLSIAVGQAKTFTVTDVVPDAAHIAGKVYFACAFSNDGRNAGGYGLGAGNPGLTAGANVVGAFGNVKGHLSGGASGENPVKIVAINPANNRVLKTNTYYSYTWSMQDLPQGPVVLKVVGRWQFEDGGTEKIVDIVGGQEVTLDLAVKSGPEVKDPSVEAPDTKLSVTFDKQTYDIGDPVQMTIKVENAGTGTQPVPSWLNDALHRRAAVLRLPARCASSWTRGSACGRGRAGRSPSPARSPTAARTTRTTRSATSWSSPTAGAATRTQATTRWRPQPTSPGPRARRRSPCTATAT